MAVLVFRTEVGSMRKLSGIFMAVVGAVLMVFGSSSNATVARGETTFYGLRCGGSETKLLRAGFGGLWGLAGKLTAAAVFVCAVC
jgi:drug/metabolite transporter (DMT)-like permease